MRLTPILIQEGRKEDLRKKYTEKFKEYPETLDFILGISESEAIALRQSSRGAGSKAP